MRTRVGVLAGAAAAVLAGCSAAVAQPGASAGTEPWHTSWASSQQRLSGTTLTDQTIRVITHLSQGGDALRIRVQNHFGDNPLTLGAATAALTDGKGAAVDGTPQPVTFDGETGVTVAAGGETWSDPVTLTTTPHQDIAVSVHLPGTTRPGEHGAAYRTNYATPTGSGDHTADPDAVAYTQTTTSTWIVSAVDVRNPAIAGTIVAYGSSVVDGEGSQNCGPGCTRTGNNERWSDVLARRSTAELPAARQLAVANAGINGTTSAPGCPGTGTDVAGLEAENRLDRDVLALHGVTGVIYYYGTNDLANGCTSAQILASWKAVFDRLRAAGVNVYLVPTTARPGYTDQMNRYRWDLGTYAENRNTCGGDCRAVLGFDQVIKDPVAPNSLNPAYDTGDGVHVNIAAQAAMAATISLNELLA